MKKRPFVLLEILIAFTLVSISILPFLRFPFLNMQKEIDTLFEMELERVAQNELTDIVEMLLQKNIPETILFAEKKERLSIGGKVELHLPGGLRRTYQKRASVYWKKQKKVNEKSLFSLVNIRVEFLNPKNKRKKSLTANLEAIAEKRG